MTTRIILPGTHTHQFQFKELVPYNNSYLVIMLSILVKLITGCTLRFATHSPTQKWYKTTLAGLKQHCCQNGLQHEQVFVRRATTNTRQHSLFFKRGSRQVSMQGLICRVLNNIRKVAQIDGARTARSPQITSFGTFIAQRKIGLVSNVVLSLVFVFTS